MAENLITIGTLAFVYLCLRAFVQLVHFWIANRTIREAMSKCPEAIEPLVGRLDTAEGGWTPKVIGLTFVIGSAAIALAAFLEKVTGLDPDLLFALILLVIGLAIYALARRSVATNVRESVTK